MTSHNSSDKLGDLAGIREVTGENPRLAAHLLRELFRNHDLPPSAKSELMIVNAMLHNYTAEEVVTDCKARMLNLINKLETDLQAVKPETAEKPAYRPVHASPNTSIPLMLSCRGVSKRLSSRFSLRDIDLDLRQGEITGIVGENGNGKTTLLKIIAGELSADSGQQRYGFTESSKWSDIKRCISYLPQELKVIPGSVRNALKLEATINGITGRDNELEVSFWIARLGLNPYEHATWSELSGGYKLRFSLAKALLARPRILVLDEPLANLDIKVQPVILRDLHDLSRSVNNPVSIVLSSLHIDEVEAVSDKIILLKEGKITFARSCRNYVSKADSRTFELKCVRDFDTVKDVLLRSGYRKIHSDGFSIVVITDPADQPQHLLDCIMDNKLGLLHFSDITDSTKIFVKGYA